MFFWTWCNGAMQWCSVWDSENKSSLLFNFCMHFLYRPFHTFYSYSLFTPYRVSVSHIIIFMENASCLLATEFENNNWIKAKIKILEQRYNNIVRDCLRLRLVIIKRQWVRLRYCGSQSKMNRLELYCVGTHMFTENNFRIDFSDNVFWF